MNKLKWVIIAFVVLISSGCTVNYNLTINEDSSVNEEFIAEDSSQNVKIKTNLEGKEAVNYMYNMYKRDNQDIDLHTTYENGITASGDVAYLSLEEYASNFKSDIFDDVKVEETNGVVTLSAKQKKMLSKSGFNTPIYDKVTINIKVPFKVIDQNSDKYNGNVYTWVINQGEDLKDIKISYQKNAKKESVHIKKDLNINYGIMASAILCTIIFIVVVIVVINNKKNNRF